MDTSPVKEKPVQENAPPPKPARWLFLVTIKADSGQMFRYGIVATRKAAAEAEAQRLAGVSADTDPETVQRSERVDSILD